MNPKKTVLRMLFVCVLMITSLSLFSQEKEPLSRCATDAHNKELLKKYPNMMGGNIFERMIAKNVEAQKSHQNTRRVVYTIPVVVHVIHNGEAVGTGTNISDAQVLSQIKVLNDDFRRMSGTRGHNTHPDGADVEIEFHLAKQTPDGCITNGINRINMSSVSQSWDGPTGSGSNTEAILKPNTIWDASKYLNIWCVQFKNSGLLGYAQFPNGPANTDGVVVGYQYFGSNDDPNVTLSGDFNLGRTMTHEVGHYLGLYHTFEGGCAETDGGDQCSDTPPVASSSTNSAQCVVNNSCTEANDKDDMIENYMDYSTDACMNVFTNDQKARMVATLTSAPNRPTTLTSDVCTDLASVANDGALKIEKINVPSCNINFEPEVRLTNWGTATLTQATISYTVDGGTPANYNWTGSLEFGEFEIVSLPVGSATQGTHSIDISVNNPNGASDSRSCNDSESTNFTIDSSYNNEGQVILTIKPDNYGSEVTWEFRDENNTLLYSGGPYTNGDTTEITETFSISNNKCYQFTIFDSRNDGICCGLFGDGYYNLKTSGGTVIASGGDYTNSETKSVSTVSFLSSEHYFDKANIRLYPNPVKSNVTIKLNNNQDLPEYFELYNMLGQQIQKVKINTTSDLSFDASAMSNGMYFVKLYKNGNTISLPFVKE